MADVLPFRRPPPKPKRPAPINTDDPHWLADALGMRDADGKPREPQPAQ